jgi:hypothetical protein
MAELVTHHGADLRKARAPQQVVVEAHRRRPEDAADVGADLRRLPGGIELVDVVRRHAIGMGHRQHCLPDGTVGDRLVAVEERVDQDRPDQHRQHEERHRDGGCPQPPAFADAPQHGIEHGRDERDRHHRHRKADELLREPRAEALRCHGVLVFANVALVDGQRQRQQPGRHGVHRGEDGVAKNPLAADALRPVAQARRASAGKQQRSDGQPEQQVP